MPAQQEAPHLRPQVRLVLILLLVHSLHLKVVDKEMVEPWRQHLLFVMEDLVGVVARMPMKVLLVMQAVLDKQGTEPREETETQTGLITTLLAVGVLIFEAVIHQTTHGMEAKEYQMLGRQVPTLVTQAVVDLVGIKPMEVIGSTYQR